MKISAARSLATTTIHFGCALPTPEAEDAKKERALSDLLPAVEAAITKSAAGAALDGVGREEDDNGGNR